MALKPRSSTQIARWVRDDLLVSGPPTVTESGVDPDLFTASDEDAADVFDGQISVSSSIVDYLSSGLYENPAACLKELINNSYDADATDVRVFVRPDADRIIVADDGTGMTRDEFVRHFSRVSESFKRDGGDKTPTGRPKIGKIGIGFIAANELCEEMQLLSTTAGSDELLKVRIDFARMRTPTASRKSQDGNVAKADYQGRILKAEVDSHFTHVFLNSIRGEARRIMAGATSPSGMRHDSSLYGRSATAIREILARGDISSWSDFDTYSSTMLRVGLNVPVQYADGWLSDGKITSEMTKDVADLGFVVNYDGTDLRKPVVLGQGRKYFVSPFRYSGKSVSAHGYFYAQHKTIAPQELNGLLVRIRNAAVGEYDQTFMEFPLSVGPLFQRWISAELWASDELEDAMNIDRRTLRVAHPAYEELRAAVHAHLRKVISRARHELHGVNAEARKLERSVNQARQIRIVSERVLAPVSPRAAERLSSIWSPPGADTSDRHLLRRYDVAELYEIVLEVARDTLPPEQLGRFVDALTARLRK
jgi:hypothetical protein